MEVMGSDTSPPEPLGRPEEGRGSAAEDTGPVVTSVDDLSAFDFSE